MTKQEKNNIINMKTVAYYSGYSGIEIKDITHGIEDYVIFVADAFVGKGSAHKALIKYTRKGEPYFTFAGNRIRLDDCIHC